MIDEEDIPSDATDEEIIPGLNVELEELGYRIDDELWDLFLAILDLEVCIIDNIDSGWTNELFDDKGEFIGICFPEMDDFLLSIDGFFADTLTWLNTPNGNEKDEQIEVRDELTDELDWFIDTTEDCLKRIPGLPTATGIDCTVYNGTYPLELLEKPILQKEFLYQDESTISQEELDKRIDEFMNELKAIFRNDLDLLALQNLIESVSDSDLETFFDDIELPIRSDIEFLVNNPDVDIRTYWLENNRLVFYYQEISNLVVGTALITPAALDALWVGFADIILDDSTTLIINLRKFGAASVIQVTTSITSIPAGPAMDGWIMSSGWQYKGELSEEIESAHHQIDLLEEKLFEGKIEYDDYLDELAELEDDLQTAIDEFNETDELGISRINFGTGARLITMLIQPNVPQPFGVPQSAIERGIGSGSVFFRLQQCEPDILTRIPHTQYRWGAHAFTEGMRCDLYYFLTKGLREKGTYDDRNWNDLRFEDYDGPSWLYPVCPDDFEETCCDFTNATLKIIESPPIVEEPPEEEPSGDLDERIAA